MMQRIFAIALNTFRESTRNLVLLGIALIVGATMFGAMVLGAFTLHEQARTARDVGIAGISLIGSLIAIFLGAVLLYNEVHRRTIQTMISKPIERYEFVLGKYAGMIATLSVLVLLFVLALAGLLAAQGVPFTSAVLKAVILGFMQVLLVAAIALFFSSFSTPFLSAAFSLGMFIAGRWTSEMREAVNSNFDDWARHICSIGLHILPDLNTLTISGGTLRGQHVSVHGDFVSWGYVLNSSLYALMYLVILLIGAIVIFSHRDFA